MQHATLDRLEAGLAEVLGSPNDAGTVALIVRRPAATEREVVSEAQLDVAHGLVGDSWGTRPLVNPKAQLTLMNDRVARLVAVAPERRPLAGDQLYVDLDLSAANLPPGSRLAVGTALIEISDEPHTGCLGFQQRFGKDALRFLSTPRGRELNLRGVNAFVVNAGTVRVGDRIARA